MDYELTSNIKIPKDINDPDFNADCIGWAIHPDDLKGIDRGTVLVTGAKEFKWIPILRRTHLDLVFVSDPEAEWQAYKERYENHLPQMNAERLEFIKEQRGVYYKDLGVHPLAYIGGDGFGFEWDGEKWLEFPQWGGVKIGDNVRIDAYTTIKKGTINDTIIGDGCKIGSHCNIGHNTILGKNCLLTHRVSIAGSCIIGERVYFGQGCIIKNKVKIGDGAIIAQGANVLKDVPPHTKVIGIWK